MPLSTFVRVTIEGAIGGSDDPLETPAAKGSNPHWEYVFSREYDVSGNAPFLRLEVQETRVGVEVPEAVGAAAGALFVK